MTRDEPAWSDGGPPGPPALELREAEAIGAGRLEGRRRSPAPTVSRNAAWMLCGHIASAGSRWLVLAILTKAVPTSAVGSYALALAVTTPAFQLSNLQLRAVISTDARRAFAFSDFLGLRLVTTPLALGACGLMAAAYGGDVGVVVGWVSLAKAAEALSDVAYGRFQQEERHDLLARSLLLESGCALGIAGAGLFLRKDLAWFLALIAAARLGTFACHDLPTLAGLAGDDARPRAALRPRWHAPTLRALSRLAAPLGVVVATSALAVAIPRVVIEQAWGPDQLGVFAALAYLPAVGVQVVTAVGQAASPRLAAHFARGERAAFRTLTSRLSLVSLAVSMGGVALAALAGSWILSLVYTPAYAQHAGLLVLLCVASVCACLASVQGYAMTAARRFRPQVPVFLAALAATAVASVALVPTFGAWSAALAILAGSCAQWAGARLVVRRALREPGGP